MADIIVRGMDMPKECGECIFCQEAWCVVKQIANDYRNDVYDYAVNATKPDWCPLVELPPHGDLIDRDELLSANRDTFTSQTELKIEFTPVIVQSNRKENEDD